MAKLTQSVVSYPDRGPWGNSRYRGNTSGHLVADLIDTYKPQTVLDPMEGGMTTFEVCEERFLDYEGYDLNDGHDLLSATTQKLMRIKSPEGVDMIFWHPPYWNMITYHETDRRDFAHGSYEQYLQRMQRGMAFLATMLNGKENSRLCILIGDLRRSGVYYWMARDISTPEKLRMAKLRLDALVIKQQNNVTSNQRVYSKPLIRIMHEYVLILKPR